MTQLLSLFDSFRLFIYCLINFRVSGGASGNLKASEWCQMTQI